MQNFLVLLISSLVPSEDAVYLQEVHSCSEATAVAQTDGRHTETSRIKGRVTLVIAERSRHRRHGNVSLSVFNLGFDGACCVHCRV